MDGPSYVILTTRLVTFLLTVAPAEAEIPSPNVISVQRNFLTLSSRSDEGAVYPPVDGTTPARVLGSTLWVGGTEMLCEVEIKLLYPDEMEAGMLSPW